MIGGKNRGRSSVGKVKGKGKGVTVEKARNRQHWKCGKGYGFARVFNPLPSKAAVRNKEARRNC
jgi:hypothetical protein